MDIQRLQTEDAVVLELAGELDAQSSLELEARCRHEEQQGCCHLVLDLSRLERVSGSGLRVLLGLARSLPGSGGTLVLCGMARKVAEAVEVSGLQRWFEIAGSRREALARSRRLRSATGPPAAEPAADRRAEVEEILKLATDLLSPGDADR